MFEYEKFRPLMVDGTGRRLTTGLFEELVDPTTSSKPIFKLSDWRRKYVSIADPTEYRSAMALIGDWDHWQLLVSNPVFFKHLNEWRKEVEVKVRSEAVLQIVKQANSPKGTPAAKWLAEGGWIEKKKGKKESEESEHIEKEMRQKVASDAKRLGLVVGGKS